MNTQPARPTLTAFLTYVVVMFGGLAAEPANAAPGTEIVPSMRPWTSALLHQIEAWPHSETAACIAAAPAGLRVQVPKGRQFAIAAASDLALPENLGRIRMAVGEAGGGAKWFVRIYGTLREHDRNLTVAIAEGEEWSGERVFELDPRMRTRPEAPVQLQLGVEGEPGAYAVFRAVEFLPAVQRLNRGPRKFFQKGQKDVAAVELMPNLPEPYELIDWREKALAYDRLAFSFKAAGEFLPLIWLDDSRINFDATTFGLPSYVGNPNQAKGVTNSQEGITCIGAVLGATLAGIDKTRQEHDYVAMCEAWFNRANGMDLVLNRQRDFGGGSFWYELFPHIAFYGLADRYPDKPRFGEILRVTADKWCQVCLDLADSDGIPQFDHLSYDFRSRQPVDNGRWREPDAAAGVAWLQYAAWMKLRDPKYLDAANKCIRFLQSQKSNPYYEVLLPFGTLVAARLNAEHGRNYDLDRMLNWCFGVSDCRGGWGVTLGRWGAYDCDGLVGSIDNRGGYAFAMNTFAQAGALVPVARYHPVYARAIGKWMLNLVNSSRLFYPGALAEGHETSAFWKGDPEHAIAYEGLRYEWQGKRPCATGDPVAMNWGPKTDLGLYGSSYAGMLAAIVRPTNVPRILQLDCLATDFFHDKAWPTFLCFNPYPEARAFEFQVGAQMSDIYDAVSGRFLQRNVHKTVQLSLPADSAAVLVVAPAGGKLTYVGNKVLIYGVVVNYTAPGSIRSN
jgi:hypothetical protein